MTHIHLDHAGGLGAAAAVFPNATLFVHHRGAAHMIDPTKLIASARRAWGAAADPLWGTIAPVPADRLVALRGGEVFPLKGGQLEVIDTPGHAQHHLAFLDTGTRSILTGDAAGVRVEGADRARPAVPPPDLDLGQLFDSLDRMAAVEPRAIWYSHFGPSSSAVADLARYREAVESWRDAALDAARSDPRVEPIAQALRTLEEERARSAAGRRSISPGASRFPGTNSPRRGSCGTSGPTATCRDDAVSELPPGKRAGPTATLFIARVVYAFNWYNVGAVLPLIGSSLAAGPVQLGIILGAFLVGAGLFQVPAGLAAIRYGARAVSLFGLVVLGAASLASAFSPNWETLAALRAVAGFGAAFFFAPALSLIASYFPAGQRGPVIGFYNGGFSIGGAAGIIGGVYLGIVGGWPLALGVGGAVLLAVAAVSSWALPEAGPAPPAASTLSLGLAARRIMGSRSIWALSLALAGFWAAIYLVAQDFVDFGVTVHPAWGVALPAALATGLIVASFPGGPVGGWLAERGRDRRALAGAFTALAGALVLVIPFAPLALLVPVMLGLGFAEGIVFAILDPIPTYLPESSGEGLALGVGVVNSIQVSIGSGLAVLFGLIVATYGYTVAWEFIGALTLGALPLLLLVDASRGGQRPSPA